MPSVQKPTNVLEEAAVDAAGAFTDGRGKNIIFKHKQLIKLFGESCSRRAHMTGAEGCGRLPKERERISPRVPRQWIPSLSSPADRRAHVRAQAGFSPH